MHIAHTNCQYIQGGICRGGEPGNSPSLDLAFPPTGLSENFPARERVIPRHFWNSAELQHISVNVVQRFKTDSV